MRVRVGLALALVVAVLAGVALSWRDRGPDPVLERALQERKIAKLAAAAGPAPIDEAPDPHDPPAPDSKAAGHSRVAEALGLVAIRCFVGEELDGDDLVGRFHQRIENGWYSHVERSLEGEHPVERRLAAVEPNPDLPDGLGDVDFETIFTVRWKASAPGETVPCTVEWPRYAEVTVRAVDDEGGPIAGAKLYGCGGGGISDANGEATWQVFADEPCLLRGHTPFVAGQMIRGGAAPLEALEEHAQVAVDLRLSASGRPDVEIPVARGPVAPRTALLRANPTTEADHREEIRVFQGLLDGATGTQAELLEGLIAHRERLIESTRERAAREAERDALMEEIESGALTPEQMRERVRELLER